MGVFRRSRRFWLYCCHYCCHGSGVFGANLAMNPATHSGTNGGGDEALWPTRAWSLGCETAVFADNGTMARLAVIYSEYPAGGRLEVYGEEIAGVRSHGDLAGLHRRRKESPMSSLRVDLITDHRRSLRPDGLKPC